MCVWLSVGLFTLVCVVGCVGLFSWLFGCVCWFIQLYVCLSLQEMISLIKQTKIPIIFMCNDRNHQKIRSLANYCFDLRFQRPRVEQIKARLTFTPSSLASHCLRSYFTQPPSYHRICSN